MSKAADLEAAIRGIRLGFNQLRALGDALHQERGINASMRAVMESLKEAGPQTVPQIARAKEVSRQHIQVIVDSLIDAGLADLKSNPQHKRSHIVVLTQQGAATFKEMQQVEKAVLKRLAAGVSAAELTAMSSALTAFNSHLRRELSAIRTSDQA